MVVTCVHVSVKPEHVEDFIDATRINHESSIGEPENVRFDVLQDPDDSSRFVLYEAYESEAGAAAHRRTPHYLTWRETVEPWMAEPRKGIAYTVIAPSPRPLDRRRTERRASPGPPDRPSPG